MDSNGHYLDISTWQRKKQYEFFRGYELPYFNVCADVEVGDALSWCREAGASFSRATWFLVQRAVNAVEPFRYRLRGDRVFVYDRISLRTTIANPDGTYRFGAFPWAENFADFNAHADASLASPESEQLGSQEHDDAVIHGSTLPWLHFKSISHPRKLDGTDCVPKISIGRYIESGGRTLMPVAVDVHHALMDGLHVSHFFEHLSNDFASPGKALAS